MSVKHAIYDVATFKALDDPQGEDNGKFEALVSVFGNVDKQGDRVVKGAFDKTLAEWKANGAPIPIIWSHNWGDPNAHIGSADPNDVVETDQGLKVSGKIDLDNPFAAQVYRLLKERRVKEFSFGYEVRKEKKSTKDGANELLDLGLIEVGPTLKGANSSTELLAVKNDLEAAAWGQIPEIETKAGRRISGATEEQIRSRITAIRSELDGFESLLAPASVDDDPDDPEKAEATGNAKAETEGNVELSEEHLDLVARIAVMKQKGTANAVS